MENGLTFQVELNFDLIQSIRLLHALLEGEGDVRVHPWDRTKLTKLEDVFGLSVSGDIENVPVLPGLDIDHERPETRIGQITRPLIFAHGFADQCRSFWSTDRAVRACFVGRLHQERRYVLRQWLSRQFSDVEKTFPNQEAVDRRVWIRDRVKTYARRVLRGPLRPLLKYVKVPPTERRMTHRNIVFATSDRGWCHPTKAWDASYFRLLADSKYVLCPDGKFVWTYRFFEAMLCGAIPIIQNRCPLYDGFFYYTMDDPLEKLEWRRNEALRNFERCRERLTVPRDRLNAEITRLLQGVASESASETTA